MPLHIKQTVHRWRILRLQHGQCDIVHRNASRGFPVGTAGTGVGWQGGGLPRPFAVVLLANVPTERASVEQTLLDLMNTVNTQLDPHEQLSFKAQRDDGHSQLEK